MLHLAKMAMKLKQTSGCNLFVMLQAQLRVYVQAAGQVLNEYIRNKMGIATVTVIYAIKITHTHVNMNACSYSPQAYSALFSHRFCNVLHTLIMAEE